MNIIKADINMMTRVYSIILGMSLFLMLSCGQKKDYGFLERAGISSIEWKKDTFGCLSYRYKKTDSILKCQQLLRLDRNDVISFFGEPNSKRQLSNDREIMFYINQPNLYCEGKVAKEYINMSDVTAIHFIFDKNGKMLEFGMKMP